MVANVPCFTAGCVHELPHRRVARAPPCPNSAQISSPCFRSRRLSLSRTEGALGYPPLLRRVALVVLFGSESALNWHLLRTDIRMSVGLWLALGRGGKTEQYPRWYQPEKALTYDWLSVKIPVCKLKAPVARARKRLLSCCEAPPYSDFIMPGICLWLWLADGVDGPLCAA